MGDDSNHPAFMSTANGRVVYVLSYCSTRNLPALWCLLCADELRLGAESLAILDRNFRQLAREKHDWEMLSFGEVLPTKLIGQALQTVVVPR